MVFSRTHINRGHHSHSVLVRFSISTSYDEGLSQNDFARYVRLNVNNN